MSTDQSKADSILTVSEFEPHGQASMSPMAFAYVSGGAADELTMHANNEDWKTIRLRPRVLVDVSSLDLGIRMLGQPFESPIMLAPAAFHRLFHSEGELATVQGANQAGAGMILSSF